MLVYQRVTNKQKQRQKTLMFLKRAMKNTELLIC